jgi:hypothetical protein
MRCIEGEQKEQIIRPFVEFLAMIELQTLIAVMR